MDIKPAEDGWDRTENKGAGIFTGKEGKYSFQLGNKEASQTAPSPSSTDQPPVSTATKTRGSNGDFQEFRQWQAWKKAKENNSADYMEFRQWLNFINQKSTQGGQP